MWASNFLAERKQPFHFIFRYPAIDATQRFLRLFGLTGISLSPV